MKNLVWCVSYFYSTVIKYECEWVSEIWDRKNEVGELMGDRQK